MKKWQRFAIPVGVVICIILIISVYTLFFTAFTDDWPAYDRLGVEQTSDNEIEFTILYDQEYYTSQPVGITDCAICLMVDNQTLQPTDMELGGPGYWVNITNYTMVKGPGLYNSFVLTDGSDYYIVIFNDIDLDGEPSKNDTIVVRSTAPLQPDIEYLLILATDIESEPTGGFFAGVLNGPYPYWIDN